jgi:hypothetical protein
MSVALAGLALIVAAAVCGWLYTLERDRRTVDVVVVLLTVLVLDVVLYPESETATQPSVFNISVGDQGIRLIQLMLVIAVLARLLARGLPRRFPMAGLLWICFFAWVGVSALVGWLAANPTHLIVRHFLVVVMIGGGLLVAGGANASDYVRSVRLQRFMVFSAVIAAVLFVTDTVDLSVTSSALPGLPVQDLGVYGADAATVFTSLGALAVGLGLGRYPGRVVGGSSDSLDDTQWSSVEVGRRVLLCSGAVMVISLLASPQRAARLSLLVMAGIMVVAMLARTGRRRLGLTGQRIVVTSALLCAVGCLVLMVGVLAHSFQDSRNAVTPTAGEPTFGATTRQSSVESRFNQWEEAWDEVRGSPFVGQGLGGTQVHFDEGQNAFVESDISHNIALDVLRRTGVFGLLLGAGAVLVTLTQAVAAWRGSESRAIAFWALSSVAMSSGLIARGLVESVLEKDRLALLLGVALGFASVAAMTRYERQEPVGQLLEADQAPDGSNIRWPAVVGGLVVIGAILRKPREPRRGRHHRV